MATTTTQTSSAPKAANYSPASPNFQPAGPTNYSPVGGYSPAPVYVAPPKINYGNFTGGGGGGPSRPAEAIPGGPAPSFADKSSVDSVVAPAAAKPNLYKVVKDAQGNPTSVPREGRNLVTGEPLTRSVSKEEIALARSSNIRGGYSSVEGGSVIFLDNEYTPASKYGFSAVGGEIVQFEFRPQGSGGMLESAPKLGFFEQIEADVVQGKRERDIGAGSGGPNIDLGYAGLALGTVIVGAGRGAANTIYGVPGFVGGLAGAAGSDIIAIGSFQRGRVGNLPINTGQFLFGTAESTVEDVRGGFAIDPFYGAGNVIGIIGASEVLGRAGGKAAGGFEKGLNIFDERSARFTVSETGRVGSNVALMRDIETGQMLSTDIGNIRTRVGRKSAIRELNMDFETNVFSKTAAQPLFEDQFISNSIGIIETKRSSGVGRSKTAGFRTQGMTVGKSGVGVPEGFDFASVEKGVIFDKKGAVADIEGKFLSKNIGETPETTFFADIGVTGTRTAKGRVNIDAARGIYKGPNLNEPIAGDIFGGGFDFEIGPRRPTKTVVKKTDQFASAKVNLVSDVAKASALDLAMKSDLKINLGLEGKSKGSGRTLGILDQNLLSEKRGSVRQEADIFAGSDFDVLNLPRGKQRQDTDVISGSFFDLGQTSDVLTIPGLRDNTRSRLNTGVIEMFATKQAVRLKTTPRAGLQEFARGFGSFDFPVGGPSRSDGGDAFGFDFDFEQKGKKGKSQYQASVFALLSGITAKRQPKGPFSGLEIRPFVI